MDFSASTMVAPVSSPVPKSVPDMRPSADAAASVRKTIPEIPVAMPTPPATSQQAEVSRSMMRDAAPVELDPTALISAVSAVERTLKPYGTSMLPQSAAKATDQARADDVGQADSTDEKEKVQG